MDMKNIYGEVIYSAPNAFKLYADSVKDVPAPK